MARQLDGAGGDELGFAALGRGRVEGVGRVRVVVVGEGGEGGFVGGAGGVAEVGGARGHGGGVGGEVGEGGLGGEGGGVRAAGRGVGFLRGWWVGVQSGGVDGRGGLEGREEGAHVLWGGFARAGRVLWGR